MKRVVIPLCAAVLIPLAARAQNQPTPASPSQAKRETTCHGTAVEFVDSPTAAAQLAAQQKKLVFVLHVSGHFEDPRFT